MPNVPICLLGGSRLGGVDMNAMLEIDDLRQRVNACRWVHTIDLGNGIVTPGAWRPSPIIRRAFQDIDFRGRKVLDIGCWDGLWSFEAERRGAAEVYATDDLSQRHSHDMPTFLVAQGALGSQARYFPHVGVDDVEDLGVNDFDIVLFCGVYYHLREPLAALARLRRVLKPGGLIVVEGTVIHGESAPVAEFFYRQRVLEKDLSNWWVPSIPCLREWVESSFFEIVSEQTLHPMTHSQRWKRWVPSWLGKKSRHYSRHLLVARAVCRKDPGYLYPDRKLAEFDQNIYR